MREFVGIRGVLRHADHWVLRQRVWSTGPALGSQSECLFACLSPGVARISG